VVDTTNFTSETRFRGSDENLHLTERFTRTDRDTLIYEFTVDDPTAFTGRWTASLPMARSDERIYDTRATREITGSATCWIQRPLR
jgi:hypothetical protein